MGHELMKRKLKQKIATKQNKLFDEFGKMVAISINTKKLRKTIRKKIQRIK